MIDQPQKTTGFCGNTKSLLYIFGRSSLGKPVVFHSLQSWQLGFSGLLLLAFPDWRFYYPQYIKIYKLL